MKITLLAIIQLILFMGLSHGLQANDSLQNLEGGLVVVLSTGENNTGMIATKLGANGNTLVHVIANDISEVARLNVQVVNAGLKGIISVEAIDIKKLPYRDFMVNGLIIMDMAKAKKAGFTMAEAKRCVAPLGKIVTCNGGQVDKVEDIPILPDMDDWTHRYKSASGVPLSSDAHFSLPLGYKWNAGLARGFNDPSGASLSNGSSRSFLAGNGRVYSLSTTVHENLGDSYKTKYGSDTYLTCRDAFNGRFLWRKKIGYMNYGRGYAVKIENQDPMALSGQHIYVPIDKEAVLKIDAISGDVINEIATGFIPGVLVTDEDLVVIASWKHGEKHEELGWKTRTSLWGWDEQDGVIEAFDTKTDKRLWKQKILAKSVLIKNGRVFVAAVGSDTTTKEKAQPEYKVMALDLKKGNILWQEKIKDAKGTKGTSLTLEGVADKVLYVIKNKYQSQFRDVVTGKVIDGGPGTQSLFRYKGGGCVPKFRVNDISLGVKWINMDQGGEQYFFDGARAACAQGTIPAYGAGYVTQNHCDCSASMIQGMMALGPIGKNPTETEMEVFAEPRVVAKYDEAKDGISSKSTWTTFRGNVERNSSSSSHINPSLKEQWVQNATSELKSGTLALDWKALLKSRLTPAVLTDKLAIVADIEHHEIIAFNLTDGSVAWRSLTGGRIDVSPTLYKGICFAGDRTGYIYALKVKTGELLYTLRVAPQEKRMVSHGKIESVWPVIGGVLVHNGKAYAAAGRSEGSDGGLVVRAFIPETGKHIWSQSTINKGGGESRLNDVLLIENGKLRLTENYMDLETGARVKSARIDYLMAKYPEETQAIEDNKDKYAATPWGPKKFAFRQDFSRERGVLNKLAQKYLSNPEAPESVIIGREGLYDGVWTHVGARRFKGIGLTKAKGAVASWGVNGVAWVDMQHHRKRFSIKSILNYNTTAGKQGEIDMTDEYQLTSLIVCKNVVVGGGFIVNRESRNTGKKGFIQIIDTATGTIIFKKEYAARLAFNGLAVNDGNVVATFNDGSVIMLK